MHTGRGSHLAAFQIDLLDLRRQDRESLVDVVIRDNGVTGGDFTRCHLPEQRRIQHGIVAVDEEDRNPLDRAELCGESSGRHVTGETTAENQNPDVGGIVGPFRLRPDLRAHQLDTSPDPAYLSGRITPYFYGCRDLTAGVESEPPDG